MSWRTGSSLFLDIWPSIQKHIEDQEERVDFTARLLRLFVQDDMDPWEVEDVHPEIRAALRKSGIGIAEPHRYTNDPPFA